MIAQGLGSIAKSASAHGLELVEGTCSKRILNEMNISLSRANAFGRIVRPWFHRALRRCLCGHQAVQVTIVLCGHQLRRVHFLLLLREPTFRRSRLLLLRFLPAVFALLRGDFPTSAGANVLSASSSLSFSISSSSSLLSFFAKDPLRTGHGGQRRRVLPHHVLIRCVSVKRACACVCVRVCFACVFMSVACMPVCGVREPAVGVCACIHSANQCLDSFEHDKANPSDRVSLLAVSSRRVGSCDTWPCTPAPPPFPRHLLFHRSRRQRMSRDARARDRARRSEVLSRARVAPMRLLPFCVVF